MYRIIGADGQPYGPVTAEQLRQWINEGRVNGQTQVQAEGADNWQPLAALPEFAHVFSAGHHATPPRTPSLLPAPSTTPPPDPDALVAEVLARNPRIDIGSCLSRGWNLVCGNFWLSVGVGFVGMVLANVPLLLGPAYAGVFWFFLRRIRGEPAKFEDLFAPFSVAFVPCLLAGLIVSILASLGFMLCIIPGLVFLALWTFTWPLLMDKRLDFWAAMEVSRRVLWPNIWGILGLFVVGMVLILVGVLCCYVGALVAIPVVFAAQSYAYEDFFGQPNTGSSEKTGTLAAVS
jgi:hypothetical protein